MDGRKAEARVVDHIRVKQILGDVLELVLNTTSSAQLKKVLNSSAWQIKKAVLVEALELGHIDKANNLSDTESDRSQREETLWWLRYRRKSESSGADGRDNGCAI
jgi:hypothetical protein